MPAHHVAQRGVHGPGLEFAPDRGDQRDVVSGGVGCQQRMQVDLPLRERKRARGDRGGQPRYGFGAASPGLAGRRGQVGHGRILQHVPEVDLHAEPRAQARGGPGGQQTVAADAEEVVEPADPLDVLVEHLGPHLGHRHLQRAVRCSARPTARCGARCGATRCCAARLERARPGRRRLRIAGGPGRPQAGLGQQITQQLRERLGEGPHIGAIHGVAAVFPAQRQTARISFGDAVQVGLGRDRLERDHGGAHAVEHVRDRRVLLDGEQEVHQRGTVCAAAVLDRRHNHVERDLLVRQAVREGVADHGEHACRGLSRGPAQAQRHHVHEAAGGVGQVALVAAGDGRAHHQIAPAGKPARRTGQGGEQQRELGCRSAAGHLAQAGGQLGV